jgi:DNA-binding response OmpR family regulator
MELVARIQSVIRRFRLARPQPHGTILRVGDAELSLNTLRYSSRVTPSVELTPTELRILECLMREAERIVSREKLMDEIWGLDGVDDTNRVDVYMRRLRRKIERDPTNPEYLLTLRGSGYVFRAVAEQPATGMISARSIPLPMPSPVAAL